MNNHVLDSSAVLAVLLEETGGNLVSEMLEGRGVTALMSTVNASETYARLIRNGVTVDEAREVLDSLGLTIVPFSGETALRTGALAAEGASLGLSLGDRACLALAEEYTATVWTADRVWQRLKTSLKICSIRP